MNSAPLAWKIRTLGLPSPVPNSSKFPREKQRPYLSLPVFVDLSSICLPSTQQGLEPLLALLLFSECMCLVYGKHSLRMTNALAKGNLRQILKLFTCQLPLPLSFPELNRHFFSPIKPGLPAQVLYTGKHPQTTVGFMWHLSCVSLLFQCLENLKLLFFCCL